MLVLGSFAKSRPLRSRCWRTRQLRVVDGAVDRCLAAARGSFTKLPRGAGTVGERSVYAHKIPHSPCRQAPVRPLPPQSRPRTSEDNSRNANGLAPAPNDLAGPAPSGGAVLSGAGAARAAAWVLSAGDLGCALFTGVRGGRGCRFLSDGARAGAGSMPADGTAVP